MIEKLKEEIKILETVMVNNSSSSITVDFQISSIIIMAIYMETNRNTVVIYNMIHNILTIITKTHRIIMMAAIYSIVVAIIVTLII